MSKLWLWLRWFHVRLSWRAIGCGVLYFLVPYLPLDPADATLVRSACMAAILAAIYAHERKPPRGGQGAPGLGLFGVRKEGQ